MIKELGQRSAKLGMSEEDICGCSSESTMIRKHSVRFSWENKDLREKGKWTVKGKGAEVSDG